MADLQIVNGGGDDFGVEDDGEDLGVEEEEKEPKVSPLDEPANEELMTALEKLERFHNSEELYDRELTAREISTAAMVIDTFDDFEKLCDLVLFMSSDTEPIIRMSVVVQTLNMFQRCSEIQMPMEDQIDMQHRLLNIPLSALRDNSDQVRRGSHICIANILEDNGHNGHIVKKICEDVASLFGGDSSYEYRLDGLVILSRIAATLQEDVLLREFAPHFEYLATDNMFHVRKAFAMCCKDIAPNLGQEKNEVYLLPLFLRLCEDEAWGVRKACADVFMDIASSCSIKIKHSLLTQVFIKLLKDTSRWVRKAAYQSLGLFITTFKPQELEEDDDDSLHQVEIKEERLSSNCVSNSSCGTSASEGCSEQVERCHNPLPQELPEDGYSIKETWIEQKLNVISYENCETEYSNLLFWKQPIPPLDLALIGTEDKEGERQEGEGQEGEGQEEEEQEEEEEERTASFDPKSESTAFTNTQQFSEEKAVVHFLDEEDDDQCTQPQSCDLMKIINRTVSEECLVQQTSTPAPLTNVSSLSDMELTTSDHPATPQSFEMVPAELLEYYFGMIDQVKVQQVDGELPFLCAYSFPGVVHTLGAAGWPQLKPIFDHLSQHMHWKIRRALAFSLHDMARLLGSETTVSDVLPVFEDFLKDVEDVRIGVLSSLSDLFKIIPNHKRTEYLPLVRDFLEDHNERNWRYRLKLAEQLSLMCHLYQPDLITNHITPLALDLASDKVSDLRTAAGELLCVILAIMEEKVHESCIDLLSVLKDEFANSARWTLRLICIAIPGIVLSRSHLFLSIISFFQALKECVDYKRYINLCDQIITLGSLSWDLFKSECLSSLLHLHTDGVPNVRIAVARVTKSLLSNSKVLSDSSLYEQIFKAVELLQGDCDNDVRCSAGGSPLPRQHKLMESESSTSLEPWFQADIDNVPEYNLVSGGEEVFLSDEQSVTSSNHGTNVNHVVEPQEHSAIEIKSSLWEGDHAHTNQEHTHHNQEHTHHDQEHTHHDQEHTHHNQEHTHHNQEHTHHDQEHTHHDQEHTHHNQEHTHHDQEHTHHDQEHTHNNQEHTHNNQDHVHLNKVPSNHLNVNSSSISDTDHMDPLEGLCNNVTGLTLQGNFTDEHSDC